MLELNHLTFKAQEKVILDHLSFSLPLGGIATLLGPSGSGKTTLLRCLAQLEKPSKGSIKFQGGNLKDLKGGHIGLVFQNFHLFPHLTVLENLLLSPRCHKQDLQKAQKKAEELLEQFFLASKAGSYPHQLSGGQKQRVAIVRALMMDPPLLLFDEPTSALDPEMVNDVAHMMIQLKSPERLIFLVTHEVRLAQKVSNTVLFMDHGRLLDHWVTEEFFALESSKRSERASRFLKNFQV